MPHYQDEIEDAFARPAYLAVREHNMPPDTDTIGRRLWTIGLRYAVEGNVEGAAAAIRAMERIGYGDVTRPNGRADVAAVLYDKTGHALEGYDLESMLREMGDGPTRLRFGLRVLESTSGENVVGAVALSLREGGDFDEEERILDRHEQVRAQSRQNPEDAMALYRDAAARAEGLLPEGSSINIVGPDRGAIVYLPLGMDPAEAKAHVNRVQEVLGPYERMFIFGIIGENDDPDTHIYPDEDLEDEAEPRMDYDGDDWEYESSSPNVSLSPTREHLSEIERAVTEPAIADGDPPSSVLKMSRLRVLGETYAEKGDEAGVLAVLDAIGQAEAGRGPVAHTRVSIASAFEQKAGFYPSGFDMDGELAVMEDPLRVYQLGELEARRAGGGNKTVDKIMERLREVGGEDAEKYVGSLHSEVRLAGERNIHRATHLEQLSRVEGILPEGAFVETHAGSSVIEFPENTDYGQAQEIVNRASRIFGTDDEEVILGTIQKQDTEADFVYPEPLPKAGENDDGEEWEGDYRQDYSGTSSFEYGREIREALAEPALRGYSQGSPILAGSLLYSLGEKYAAAGDDEAVNAVFDALDGLREGNIAFNPKLGIASVFEDENGRYPEGFDLEKEMDAFEDHRDLYRVGDMILVKKFGTTNTLSAIIGRLQNAGNQELAKSLHDATKGAEQRKREIASFKDSLERIEGILPEGAFLEAGDDNADILFPRGTDPRVAQDVVNRAGRIIGSTMPEVIVGTIMGEDGEEDILFAEGNQEDEYGDDRLPGDDEEGDDWGYEGENTEGAMPEPEARSVSEYMANLNRHRGDYRAEIENALTGPLFHGGEPGPMNIGSRLYSIGKRYAEKGDKEAVDAILAAMGTEYANTPVRDGNFEIAAILHDRTGESPEGLDVEQYVAGAQAADRYNLGTRILNYTKGDRAAKVIADSLRDEGEMDLSIRLRERAEEMRKLQNQDVDALIAASDDAFDRAQGVLPNGAEIIPDRGGGTYIKFPEGTDPAEAQAMVTRAQRILGEHLGDESVAGFIGESGNNVEDYIFPVVDARDQVNEGDNEYQGEEDWGYEDVATQGATPPRQGDDDDLYFDAIDRVEGMLPESATYERDSYPFIKFPEGFDKVEAQRVVERANEIMGPYGGERISGVVGDYRTTEHIQPPGGGEGAEIAGEERGEDWGYEDAEQQFTPTHYTADNLVTEG